MISISTNYTVFGEPVLFPPYCIDENLRQGYWGEFYIYMFLKIHGPKFGIFNVRFPSGNPERDQYGSVDLRADLANGKTIKIQVKTISRLQYSKPSVFNISIGVTGAAYDAIQECDVLIIIAREPRSDKVDGDKEWGGQVLIVKDHKKYPLNNGFVTIPANPENFIKLTQMWPEHLAQANSFKSFKRK